MSLSSMATTPLACRRLPGEVESCRGGASVSDGSHDKRFRSRDAWQASEGLVPKLGSLRLGGKAGELIWYPKNGRHEAW